LRRGSGRGCGAGLQALGPDPSFTDQVTVAACLAAASTAVLARVENDGSPELPDLIEQAFDALSGAGTGPLDRPARSAKI
jgi:hypothetical protein